MADSDKPIPTVTPTAQDLEDSKALDSPHMEALNEVAKLTRLPDGTTLVRYHFASDDAAVRLCMDDSLLPIACEPAGDVAKRADMAAMEAIVRESGAKIRFEETKDASVADIDFLQYSGIDNSPEAVLRRKEGKFDGWTGYQGRADGQSYTVLNPVIDEAMLNLHANNKPVSEDKKVASLAEDAVHEIMHRLGAKHSKTPDLPGKDGVSLNAKTLPQDATFSRTEMGAFYSHHGELLGPVDIAWMQRHYGKAEAAESIEAPTVAAKLEPAKKER